MFIALVTVLFFPDLWIVLDRPNNSELNVILTFVLLMFIMELVVQSIGLTRTYWGSFFFWMDLLGAFSVLLDLDYLPLGPSSSNSGDAMSNNAVILRTARIAKLGARAGRFTKLVKLLRFLPGMRQLGPDQGTAKVISNRLVTALSTRVSCLIIVMVMIIPLFSMWTYPEQDWSAQSWLEILDKLSVQDPAQFRFQLERFWEFYRDMNYFPFELHVRSSAELSSTALAILPWHAPRDAPQRASNIVSYESTIFICNFSFKQSNQIQALTNMGLLVFIMVLMVCFSLILSNSVSGIVLRPLEKLLAQVRKMASKIFKSVADMANYMAEETQESDSGGSESDTPQEATFGTETNLLGKVVQKLTVLSSITLRGSGWDEETMAGLGHDDRAMISGYGGAGHQTAAWSDTGEDDEGEERNLEEVLLSQNTMLLSVGLSPDLLNSWNFNPLELDKQRNRAAMTYFMSSHNHGVSFDAVVMGKFLEAAEDGYSKTSPYHNWFHAVDVTHGVFRLLGLCTAEAYLSTIERYALLVSAACHDVGHPGLNNVFLVEASHELALRYNDKSPLENMHCARLFEFVSMPGHNVFGGLTRQHFQEARKCCIEAILHTDNSQHFPMIKEVQTIYEVNSELLDNGRILYYKDDIFPTKEVVDFFRAPEQRRVLVQLLLHYADLSNCTKPFRICRIWAWQVLEEFFAQGDEELTIGLPVQALNDREKVNKPFSQVGFIEFLVSPLLFAVMKVLPPTVPCAQQMVSNTKMWHHIWLTESKKTPEESEQRALAERVAKLEKRYEDSKPVT